MKRAIVLFLLVAGCATAEVAPSVASRAAPAPLRVRGRPVGERRFAHDALVTAVGFSNDSQRVVTGGADGFVRVFDLEGRELERREAHAQAVTFVGYRADGTLVSASALEKRVRVGAVAFACSRAPTVSVSRERVAWTESESTIAVLEPDGSLRRIERDSVSLVALSPTGERVAAIQPREIAVLDAATGRRIFSRAFDRFSPRDVAFLDETTLAFEDDDRVRAIPVGHLEDLVPPAAAAIAGPADRFAVGRDGTIVTAWWDGTIQAYRGRKRWQASIPQESAGVAISPDGLLVAAPSYTTVTLLRAESGARVHRAAAFGGPIRELAFEGSTLTSRSEEGRVLRCSPAGEWRAVEPLYHQRSPIIASAVSPGETLVALGLPGGALEIVDAETHAELRSWRLEGPVEGVRFALDGSAVAVVAGAKLRVYDLASGAERSVNGPAGCRGFGWTGSGLVWLDDANVLRPAGVALEERGRFAVFSPSGDLVALGAAKEVRVCETATGRRVALLEGHRREVTALAFSADGRRLASGDAAGALWVWELR